jgi:hypothetical protein
MVYTTIQLVARSFRLNVQFRGSSGSSLGCGTRRTSFCPLPSACLDDCCPDVSMSRTVPGGKASVDVMPGFSDIRMLMYDDRVEVVRDKRRIPLAMTYSRYMSRVAQGLTVARPLIDSKSAVQYNDKLRSDVTLPHIYCLRGSEPDSKHCCTAASCR